MLYEAPPLDELELAVCQQFEQLRREYDTVPVSAWPHRLWAAKLWRLMLTQAAAAPRPEDSSADACDLAFEACAAALADDAGYRNAMSLALHFADDPSFAYSVDMLKQMHYTLLSHAPRKRPGQLRDIPVVARHERTREVFYTAPPSPEIPPLLSELMGHLNTDRAHPLVRAAMAHFNCASIHPFTDANGRLSRCLHTLVLAKAGYLSSAFCGLDQYLGSRTQEYNDCLGFASGPVWNPPGDVRPWIRFCLRGHLWQAQMEGHAIQWIRRLGVSIEEALHEGGVTTAALPVVLEAVLERRVVPCEQARGRHAGHALAFHYTADLVRAGFLISLDTARVRAYGPSARVGALVQRHRTPPPRLSDPFPRSGDAARLRDPSAFWKVSP